MVFTIYLYFYSFCLVLKVHDKKLFLFGSHQCIIDKQLCYLQSTGPSVFESGMSVCLSVCVFVCLLCCPGFSQNW